VGVRDRGRWNLLVLDSHDSLSLSLGSVDLGPLLWCFDLSLRCIMECRWKGGRFRNDLSRRLQRRETLYGLWYRPWPWLWRGYTVFSSGL